MGSWTWRPGKHWLLMALVLGLCPTGGCNQGAWSLWKAYAARFIDAQGRVVDRSSGDRTTSEGEAYAMFFALVGNDRASIDRLLGWTQANMAGGDLHTHLPSWLWGHAKDGQWKTLDPNSASDADVWMAYTLIEAGRLWKAPAYTSLGRAMMNQIASKEIANLPGFGLMLMPGPSGFQHDQVWTLNPSYVPVFLFERFAKIDPAGPWQQIALGVPRLIEGSARHGFAMDWVNYIPGDGFYPAVGFETGNKDSEVGGGSYDAIRVYLWLGMTNESAPMRAQMLNDLPAMSIYLADHDAPPEKVSDQGIPQAQDGPVGFSAAMVPYLRAYPGLAKLSALQMARMDKLRDPSSGLYGKELAYYDQNLALFSTGFTEDRFRFGPAGELTVQWVR
ncbi:MAG: cellulose synthase complex periplasmic endoglucanase BcsZ [Terracidiphilus sp.]